MISFKDWKILRESAFAAPLGIVGLQSVGAEYSEVDVDNIGGEELAEAKKKMKKKMMSDVGDEDEDKKMDAETGDGEVVEPSSDKDKGEDEDGEEGEDEDVDSDSDEDGSDDEKDMNDEDEEGAPDKDMKFMKKKGKKKVKKESTEEDDFLRKLADMITAGRAKSVNENAEYDVKTGNVKM